MPATPKRQRRAATESDFRRIKQAWQIAQTAVTEEDWLLVADLLHVKPERAKEILAKVAGGAVQ